LIRLEPVLEILQAILWTGRLSTEAPVSACLVADSQSAKSECLKYFALTPTIKLFTDVTSKGIIEQIRLIELKRLRHIVLMDLHMVVSHNRYTADRTLLTLGGLMEEGLAGIADAGGETKFEGMPRIGVLMGVTPGYYHQRRGHWRRTGFLSRFLTVTYVYSEGTKAKIHEAIRDGFVLPDPRNEALPEDAQDVTIREEDASLLMEQARLWGTEQKDPAYRYHKQLRRLLKASALIHGRHTTDTSDISRIIKWMRFFNPSTPVEL